MSSVIYSNSFEKLYQSLKEELFQSSNPLKPKIIVVPSQKVKDWLQQRLISDPDVGIAMGLQFMGVTNALEWLCPFNIIPHPLSLALQTEQAIYTVLDEPIDACTTPLHDYFASSHPQQLGLRVERLADCLSQIFMLYERYGGAFFAKWRKKMGWIQKVWSITAEERPVLCDRLVTCKMTEGVEIFLFNVGFMPSLYLQFFENVKAFQFSPCGVYWGDINRKSEEDNPLLAHWGRLGKCLSLSYDNCQWQIIDRHREIEQSSTLSNVQQAIFHSLPSVIPAIDSSIEIHTAVTRLREVEVVKECLIHLLSTRHAGVKLEQIAVYAPDITVYAPFIEHVFSDSPFPYVIYDMPLEAQSDWFQAMTALIDLAQSRLEPSAVINFFSMPCVQRGCDLKSDDIRQLQIWSEKGQVRWGYDQSMRDAKVCLPGHSDPLIEQSEAGTWTFAFHGLMNGLIAIEDEALDPSLWPLDFVEFSQAEVLGQWMTLLKELSKSIELIQSGEKKTVDQWKAVFAKLDQTFFEASEHDKGYQLFFQSCGQCQAKGVFSFCAIWDRLKASVSSHSVNAHTHVQNGIQFSSLRTGRTTPSAICWILGLHDGCYPRSDPKISLNEMDNEADLMPTHADEDRYLFLELLASTQDQFNISYINRSDQDSKEQGPCILVDDLCNFCQGILVIHHPEHPFDSLYFSDDFAYPSYQEAYYNVASCEQSQAEKCVLIPQFFGRTARELNEPCEVEIDISHIKQFAKNPLAYFIKQRLGVFLEYKDETDQEFQLALLEKIRLRSQYQQMSLQRLIEQAQFKGRLPLGRFKELAIESLNQEHKEMQNLLQKFNINESDLFSIQLDRHNVNPLYIGDQQWICPAIEIPLKNQTLYITGTLDRLTPKGMVIDGKLDLPSLVKVWPLWLIASLIAQRDKLGGTELLTQVANVAAPSLDPLEGLKAYMDYFLRAQSEPSPLMPFWVEDFLKDDFLGLQAAISKSTSQATMAVDPYVLWAMSYENDPSVNSMVKNWSGLAKDVFVGIYGSL